jgi:UDP-2-acetamido-2,6-beta-L-arabino-hexul-4-ose reductase
LRKESTSVSVDPLPVFTDARGMVFNPIEIAALAHQQNLHVVTSKPQAVRGNHYHPQGTETIIVVGPALMRVREKQNIRDINIPDRAVFRLTIPPGVSHAIKHTGTTDGILLSFNSVSYDPENPDIVQDVLL